MKRILSIFFLMIAFGVFSSAQEKTSNCQIKVTTPQPGDKVGKDGRVRGTAKIPPETHLWVLSHMKDLTEEWWPQGKRPVSIDPKTGEWVIITGYGRPEDVNRDFEVAIAVVGEGANQALLDWFKDAKEKD